MKPLPHIQLGIYKHYKGMECEAMGVGRHSETLEPMVIYRELKDGSLWLRPFSMFTEAVVVNGTRTPRFQFLRKA
jgi:hypothetical protein